MGCDQVLQKELLIGEVTGRKGAGEVVLVETAVGAKGWGGG